MKGRRTLGLLIPLLLLVLAAVPAARFLWYYRGMPGPRDVPQPDLSRLAVPTPGAGAYVDRPAVGRGLVLVDRAHENLYSATELSVLTARLTARGLTVRELAAGDDLEQALRPASALIVVAPGRAFTPQEIAAVRRFVDRGGRALLVADPTRYTVLYDDYGEAAFADTAVLINPLATPFGLSFEDDYLYNVVRHEGNYQNILLRDFAAGALTAGLAEVAFYATHSIHVAGGGLIVADADTHSSTDELGGELAVAALDGTGKVLLLGDLTFMTSPYAGVLDNGRLVANVADFLAAAERRYGLADFPYFFGDEVALVPSGGSPLGAGPIADSGALQAALQAADRRTVVRAAADPARDNLFVGVFSDTAAVADALEAAGIAVQAVEAEEGFSYTLTISGTGAVDGTDLALFLLQQGGDQTNLTLLADRGETMPEAVQRLTEGNFSGCLALSETLLLCALGEGRGGWDGGGDDGGGEDGAGDGAGILVVSDDELYMTTDCSVGAYYYELFLYADYTVELWSVYDQGNPTLEDLRQHVAVFWVAGTCAGVVPSAENAETLRSYVAGGGRLLLEGAYIGTDWGGSDFYTEVCRAEYLGNGELLDLAVADAGHPLAQGWAKEQTLTLVDGGGADQPDVVGALAGAAVVLARGPTSAEPGTPAVIAYEEGDARVVYAAFPLFSLSEEDLDTLIRNAAAWLVD